MPSFSYTGRNTQGKQVQGILNSQDANTATRQLSAQGTIPLQVSPEQKTSQSGSFSVSLFAEPITPLDIMMLSRQMYSLLKAGISILQGGNAQELA